MPKKLETTLALTLASILAPTMLACSAQSDADDSDVVRISSDDIAADMRSWSDETIEGFAELRKKPADQLTWDDCESTIMVGDGLARFGDQQELGNEMLDLCYEQVSRRELERTVSAAEQAAADAERAEACRTFGATRVAVLETVTRPDSPVAALLERYRAACP